MSLSDCSQHRLYQNIICCEEECLRLFCYECFKMHNPAHTFGVFLKVEAQQTLLKWNHLLIVTLGEMKASIKVKGSSAFFQMKLNPSYPKGLINEISTSDINEISRVKLEECLLMLQGNVDFISGCHSLPELNIPGVLKDIFLFFLYDTTRNLSYLLDNIQLGLRDAYPDKKIYEYIYFSFNPKILRTLELKRKEFVRSVEQDCLVKLANVNTPYSPTLNRAKKEVEVFSPKVQRILDGEMSPRSPRSPKLRSQRILTKVEEPAIEKSPKQEKFTKSVLVENFKSKQEEQQCSSTVKSELELETSSLQTQGEKFTSISQLQEGRDETGAEKIAKQEQKVESWKGKGQGKGRELVVEMDKSEQVQSEKDEMILKLRSELELKEKSIQQLNKLINNEEEELSYRENQVQVLGQEIKKLIATKQENEVLRERVQNLSKELEAKEKSIQYLNNLISNEEEELIYRQNEVYDLSSEIKKLQALKIAYEAHQKQVEAKQREEQKQYEAIRATLNLKEKTKLSSLLPILKNLCQSQQSMKEEVRNLEVRERNLQQRIKQLQKMNQDEKVQTKNEEERAQIYQSIDDQLLAEVIELEAEIAGKNEDIKVLICLIGESSAYLPQQKREEHRKKLASLKRLRLLN